MNYRRATEADCPLLAELNHQLIRDEGHRNRMTVAELERRMRGWIAGEYTAILFEENGAVAAYALYAERADEVCCRQFCVARDRRRQGVGRRAFQILRSKFWPRDKRLTIEVLIQNAAALAFWRSVGFADYCLTLEIPPDPVSRDK